MKKILALALLFSQHTFACEVSKAFDVANEAVNDVAKDYGAQNYYLGDAVSTSSGNPYYEFSYFFQTKNNRFVTGVMKVDQKNCSSTSVTVMPASKYTVE